MNKKEFARHLYDELLKKVEYLKTEKSNLDYNEFLDSIEKDYSSTLHGETLKEFRINIITENIEQKIDAYNRLAEELNKNNRFDN